MSVWICDVTHGPARLRADLSARGYSVTHMGAVARDAAISPWSFAQTLFRETPRMLERQPIRAVEGGRSFASTSAFTPLHSDSQFNLGAPPDAQVMVCARAAVRGGETHLVDAWDLAANIERDDPRLFEALFHTRRRIPFVFGDVYGPTLALRGAALAFTHSPMNVTGDPIAEQLAHFVCRCTRLELRIDAGEVLVVDNRRMLHGRAAFDDHGREFVRLLAWLDAPLGEHPRYTARARAVADDTTSALEAASAAARARFGIAQRPEGEPARRLNVVLDMLRGMPPGVLAAREGIAEPVLYAWRDAAITGAVDALCSVNTEAVETELSGLVGAGEIQRKPR